MKATDYSRHVKVRPLEALAFRTAARYEPVLEGLTRAFVSKDFMHERERAGCGVGDLVRASITRFDENGGRKKMWSYTKHHSFEVARFSYVMAREARELNLPDAKGTDAGIVFAGGLVHDVGKTFIPIAILVKELGVDFGIFTAFKDEPLSNAERRILREEHVASGTKFVRLFGGGPHIRTLLDIVGLHHVMYNGKDSGVPSYPSLLCGKDLPFHARAAKVADFLSAVLPRHYRVNGYIDSLEGALAYAITAAGTELDPVALGCFMSGTFEVTNARAMGLIMRLRHPHGQEGVSSIGAARTYSKDVVRKDPEFMAITAAKDEDKKRRNEREMEEHAGGYGIPASSLWTS